MPPGKRPGQPCLSAHHSCTSGEMWPKVALIAGIILPETLNLPGAGGLETKNHTSRGGHHSLEQDLTAVLWLEAQSLKFRVTFLVPTLALAIFFLLQLENLLERSLGHGGGNIVFAVEVLRETISIIQRRAWQ